MLSAADASLSDFPRLADEADDSPRFARAIAACPSGVLYVPAGVYEIAAPLVIDNLCSLLLHKSAILRAVRAMDFVLTVDCRRQWDKALRTPDMPEDYNLFLSGGQIDGNGLASCLSLCAYHHFTFADMTILNGKVYGVKIDDGERYGYELIANNIYCKTVLPGLAGNVAMYICGGDSHYTDIVVVDYTIGFKLVEHAWANRLTRCHVWGGPVPPPAEGALPEMLKDSVNFEIHVGGNILRDCYADTGEIGFLIDAETRMDGCSYFSNPVFKLDGITCISHKSGKLTVADMTFSKTATSVKIYDGCGAVTWRDCKANGFADDEIPFAEGSASATPQRLA